MSTRLEEYAESPPSRRRYRFHPMMLHEMMHMVVPRGNRDLAILIVASMFRDDLPWVYEAGMEAYRAARSGDAPSASAAREEFLRLAEITWHGPWAREFMGGRGKEGMMIMEELRSLMHEFVLPEQETKRARRKPGARELPDEDASSP